MNKRMVSFAASLTLVLVLLCTGSFAQDRQIGESTPDEGQRLVNAGVAAFKHGQYEGAVQAFQKAVQLDPADVHSRLYLGAAYAVQVIPNLRTPENLKMAASALGEFDVVLKDHPDDVTALRQEASLFRNILELDKAKSSERALLALDVKDTEALYEVGAIDWQQAYKNAVDVLAKEKLTDDGQGNATLSAGGCELLRAQNEALVGEGIASLSRAIELRPTYDDAMAYLNLMYRRRADLHCGNGAAAAADVELADQWQGHAMEARKANEGPAK